MTKINRPYRQTVQQMKKLRPPSSRKPSKAKRVTKKTTGKKLSSQHREKLVVSSLRRRVQFLRDRVQQLTLDRLELRTCLAALYNAAAKWERGASTDSAPGVVFDECMDQCAAVLNISRGAASTTDAPAPSVGS